MAAGQFAASPRRFVAAFLLLVLVPSALLVVLGWQLYEREGGDARQRLEALRNQAASAIVSSLDVAVTASERALGEQPSPGAAATNDAAVIIFGPGGLAHAPTGVPFVPVPNPGAPHIAEVTHPAAATAGNLLERIRAAGAPERVALYATLSKISGVSIEGVPAELFARVYRADALMKLGRRDLAGREASSALQDLHRGRWSISKAVFEANVSELRDSGAVVRPEFASAERLARAVDAWWRSGGSQTPSGRRLINDVTVLWVRAGEKQALLAALPAFAERQWLRPAEVGARRLQMKLAWRDPAVRGDTTIEEPAGATGLPWTLVVTHADADGELARFDDRRRLWLVGFGGLVLMVIGGTYFIARSIGRELAVARLQSDFVAAVSHEFRTPLTSMRQLTEILVDDRVTADDRRRAYYGALARQTDRLHRLVESLLDLGRLEAGRSPYRLEPLDACALVRSVAEDFARETTGQGVQIELDINGDAVQVAGDRDALTNALWNLLDNAVKYSPDRRHVRVSVVHRADRLLIRVRDEGIGIPQSEQRAIFDKFVRGSAAKAAGFTGTGIGLSMVRHIVRAHGGDVQVESAPGAGSTFTLALPLAKAE